MFDDQTTSRWIPANTLGLPVHEDAGRAQRAQRAAAELLNESAPRVERTQPGLESVVPLWFRALLPGLALFAATSFGGVLLFVQPSPRPAPVRAVQSAPPPPPSAPRAGADGAEGATMPSPARVAERTAHGTLRINSRPWSHVFVDGRAAGHTPILGLALTVGEHEVELVNEALDVRKTLRVKIRHDQVVTKLVMLVD